MSCCPVTVRSCNYCGAPIIFAARPGGGKALALNAEPVADGAMVVTRGAGGNIARAVDESAEARIAVETGSPRHERHRCGRSTY